MNGKVIMTCAELIGRRNLTQSNAEQVKKIRVILEELGCEMANPAEVRQMLDVKGADGVNF